MTSASLETERPRLWRWEGLTLATLFGFGLILWPFLSFGAVFMFDAPIQSRSDWMHRTGIAYFIWFYPVTYVAALLAYFLLRWFGAGRFLSCFAWGLPVAVFFLLPTVLGWRGIGDTNQQRVQVLFRTDHDALLAACRGVMTNRAAFKQRKDDAIRSFIDPKDKTLPAVILSLHPIAIVSDTDECVYLELLSGSDRYGVIAYSEKTVSSHTNAMSRDILLTPGLWFTDAELNYRGTDRAEYINKLKAMKPADAPEQKW